MGFNISGHGGGKTRFRAPAASQKLEARPRVRGSSVVFTSFAAVASLELSRSLSWSLGRWGFWFPLRCYLLLGQCN